MERHRHVYVVFWESSSETQSSSTLVAFLKNMVIVVEYKREMVAGEEKVVYLLEAGARAHHMEDGKHVSFPDTPGYLRKYRNVCSFKFSVDRPVTAREGTTWPSKIVF
jgi:hypothetical protein